MPPYLSDVLLPQLKTINRTVGPVRGSHFARLIGQPESTVRYWLRQLEREGVVHRPRGSRSGWQAKGKA
ncbi:MAG: hypothetical protein JNJ61_04360 [Anaerolineae bacterium]|nr:hypothetical protein [Anaerolineae bacterium]